MLVTCQNGLSLLFRLCCSRLFMFALSSFRLAYNSLISLPKLPQSNLLKVALGGFLLLIGVHEFGGEGEECI